NFVDPPAPDLCYTERSGNGPARVRPPGPRSDTTTVPRPTPGPRGDVVMRTCAILPAVTAALLLVGAPGAAEAPADVEQLVARLGSPAYRERAAATRALDALGEAALDALHRAAKSADPEARRRAGELVERIELRL